MAVLFQMFHVGIIRNRISKNLMSVSLQVTVNCLCHGSSVKTQRIKEEQLETKPQHKTSVSALSRSPHSARTDGGQTSILESHERDKICSRYNVGLDQQGNKFDPLQFLATSLKPSIQIWRLAGCLLHSVWEHPQPPSLRWWCMSVSPLMPAHNNPRDKARRVWRNTNTTTMALLSIKPAQIHPFIREPICDLLPERRCPHADGCWGEIRLMAINGEEGNTDEAFHPAR